KVALGETFHYFRGPHGELLSERTKANTPEQTFRDYIYAGSRLIATVRTTSSGTTPFGVTFSLSRVNGPFSRFGGTEIVYVRTNPTNARWSVSGLPSWLHGAPGGVGSNAGQGTPYELTADPNTTHQTRTQVITIAGISVTVVQGFGEKGELLPGARLYPT